MIFCLLPRVAGVLLELFAATWPVRCGAILLPPETIQRVKQSGACMCSLNLSLNIVISPSNLPLRHSMSCCHGGHGWPSATISGSDCFRLDDLNWKLKLNSVATTGLQALKRQSTRPGRISRPPSGLPWRSSTWRTRPACQLPSSSCPKHAQVRKHTSLLSDIAERFCHLQAVG
jgi:hypothetical protein